LIKTRLGGMQTLLPGDYLRCSYETSRTSTFLSEKRTL
jgi:hypothetical protein